MSVVAALAASLREGAVGAISGGVSGSTMILPCLPLESIMTFQAAGALPGKPSMLDVAKHLHKSAHPPPSIPITHSAADLTHPRPPAPAPRSPRLCTRREGGMQRFFKGAPIIWIVVLTEKAGLFFWYALLKSLYASWAGVPFSAVAGVAALFCGWGAENLAIPTRYPFGPPRCSPLVHPH